MSDFDPYLKWLGIRDPQRPPNHYQLLGLDPFESEADVISGAADRQMAHVRTFQLGPQGEVSQRILSELAEARRCLLSADSKQSYDAALTELMNQQAMLPPIPPVSAAPKLPVAQAIPTATSQSPFSQTNPVFSGTTENELNIQKPASGFSPSIAPGKPKKDRSKQRAVMMLAGWLAGGLAAVGVGYWLLKADVFGRNSPDIVDNNHQNSANSNSNQVRQPRIIDPKKTNNNIAKNGASNGSTKPTIENNPPESPPWMKTDWPDPPAIWLSPSTELDRLLQQTRFAIGKRNYEQARKEWAAVRQSVQNITPDLLFGILASESSEFWSKATAKARTLKIGDEFEFLGQTVRVEKRAAGQLGLSFQGQQRTFELEPSVINRDLAVSLLKIDDEYSPAKIDRILASDYSHYKFPILKSNAVVESAPWENPDWPKPPSSLLNPRTELDRLVQSTRIAIGQREYRKAVEAWAKIKQQAQELDPDLDLLRDVTSMFRMLTDARTVARTLSRGDRFQFLDNEVEVVQRTSRIIRLRAGDQFEQTFELIPEKINRDLAISLLLHGKQSTRSEIDRALVGDFLHFDTSGVQLPTFFDKPKPTTEVDPFAPPAMENGVVDVNDPDGGTTNANLNVIKSTVPTAPEIAAATRDIQSLYSEAFDKNSGFTKLMGAVQLMVDAASSTKDPAMKYVMLLEAHKIAADIGESKMAFETLNLLGRNFDLDFWSLARKTVTEVNKKAKTFVQVNDLHGNLLELIKNAIAQKQYKDAAIFAGKATAVAKKLDDEAAYNISVALRNDVREMEKMFDRAEKAKATIAVDENDESANLYLGEYYCLVEGDTEAGLPYWAKSGNERYQSLAARVADLGDEPTLEHLMAVADSWHYLGKNNKTFKDRQFLIRSRPWYQQIASESQGVLQKKAELLLKETEGLELTYGKSEPDGIFNRTWIIDVDRQQFEAIFFKNGRVQFKFGDSTGLFPWRVNGEEIVVPYSPDSSIFHFDPDSSNTTLEFRKTRARDGRTMSRGTGTSVEE